MVEAQSWFGVEGLIQILNIEKYHQMVILHVMPSEKCSIDGDFIFSMTIFPNSSALQAFLDIKAKRTTVSHGLASSVLGPQQY